MTYYKRSDTSMTIASSSGAKQVRGIKAKELHDLLQSPAKDDIVLVDARTAGEQDVSKLPGNVLTKEEFEKQKDSLKDKQLICYWYVGNCARCKQRSW